VEKTVRNNREGAQYLAEELSAIGLKPLPTWANFVYVDAGEDATELARRLQSEGIIIRPLGNWGAPTAMRVSIGTPAQNRAFVSAMRKVVECPAV
jgi:histidinol-phosphate aminotransferase